MTDLEKILVLAGFGLLVGAVVVLRSELTIQELVITGHLTDHDRERL